MEEMRTIFMEAGFSFAQSGLRIVLVVIGGWVALRVLKYLLHRLETFLVLTKAPTEVVAGSTEKRVKTLVGILSTIGHFAIWAAVLLIALDQVGVNVAPLIAGAGIAGLAIGFGAQNLVRTSSADFS
jgi:small conductance mechanosensitive channel